MGMWDGAGADRREKCPEKPRSVVERRIDASVDGVELTGDGAV